MLDAFYHFVPSLKFYYVVDDDVEVISFVNLRLNESCVMRNIVVGLLDNVSRCTN